MADTHALKAKLDKALAKYQPRTIWFHAWTGDDSGNINVPGKTDFIYVTDWNGITHEALNEVVPTDHAGYAVRVGIDPDDPSQLRVLGLSNVYTQATYPKLPSHHATHEWPGTDTVWVQGPQITPALVIGKSGLTVAIFPFMLRMLDGTSKYISYQELDLTPYVPAAGSGARWVVIAFSQSTGARSVQPGSIVSGGVAAMVATNVPAPASGTIPLAAVACYYGQSAVTQNSMKNDIMDLRWLGTGGSVSTGLQFYDDIPASDVLPASPGTSSLPARGDHAHGLTIVRRLIASLAITGFLTSAQLTADTNDYNPAGLFANTVLRMTLNANHNLTGIVPTGRGQLLLMHNVDTTFSLTLKHNDTGSSAANRFQMAGAADIVLTPNSVAILQYDDLSACWRVVSGGGGGGGSGDMLKAVYDLDNDGVVDDSESTHALRGKSIDPSLTPSTNHSLFWDGTKYVDGAGPVSVEDDLTAQVTGSTAHFTTSNMFLSGTLIVFDNGVAQRYLDITEDGGLNGFTLTYTPPAGHKLFVRYVTSSGPLAQVNATSPAEKIYRSLNFF